MGSSVHPRLLQWSLPQHILFPSESSIPRGSSYFCERNGKHLLNMKQTSKQDKILTSKDFELINEKMNECWLHPLKYTHNRLSLSYLYFKVCRKGTIFCLSLWSFMSLIWWDCYLAELRPGLFSGGELSLVLLYFPQGLMGICFPSTWHHLHPKYFLGIISSVVKFGFKTFYWGLDFPLSLQSIRSVLSVRWIQVYPWFFWLVMKKHQVYVTIKLPPRSKPNRGKDPSHTNSLSLYNLVWWLARIYQNTSENVSCLGCIL